jgi:hypothetical protein
LTQVIDGIPTSFVGGGRGRGTLGGCVIGFDPNDPTLCIDGQTQSITSGIFRSRIGQIGLRGGRGRSSWTLNFSHNVREYLDEGASLAPGAPVIDPTLADRFDITSRITARYALDLRPGERVAFGVFGSRADLALRRERNFYTVGGRVSYDRRLTEQLNASASLSMRYRIDDDDGDTRFNSLASAGLRYVF